MELSAAKLWSSAQQLLRSRLNAEIYHLWFAPLRAVCVDSERLTLEVPNDFSEVWLKDNYLDLIQDALGQCTGESLRVDFLVGNGVEVKHQPSETSKHAPKKEDTVDTTNREIPFNPKNTFDTFVVGNNNTFAHAAALAVAQAPGKSYNPLFLYGGVGLGKTHLLHAIGQHVCEHKKGARVAYVSSEKFTNEYIDAIQNSHLVRFRKKYRQTDVLLIDDIQFLAGKERIQEEFFHTFNALHESHKQIVLTCDRP